MRCNQCGHEAAENGKFCQNCGSVLLAPPPPSYQETVQPGYAPPAQSGPQDAPAYTSAYGSGYGEQARAEQNENPYNSQYGAAPGATPDYVTAAPTPPGAKAPNGSVLSMGQYLGALVLFMIPLVGLILACVWAFSSNENPNRKNLARAALIVMAIQLVLFILVATLFGIAAFALFEGVFDSYYYDDFGDFFDHFDYFGHYAQSDTYSLLGAGVS